MFSVVEKKSERMILLSSKGEEEGQQYSHTTEHHQLRSSLRTATEFNFSSEQGAE